MTVIRGDPCRPRYTVPPRLTPSGCLSDGKPTFGSYDDSLVFRRFSGYVTAPGCAIAEQRGLEEIRVRVDDRQLRRLAQRVEDGRDVRAA